MGSGIRPQRGERKLAGGERSEPPGRRGTTIRTPAGVAGAPRARARAHSFLAIFRGGSPCSPPAKLPASFQGAWLALLIAACHGPPVGMSARKAHNPNVRSATPEKENPEGTEPEIAQSGASSAQRATSERRRRVT